jgi:murein DD-endopeptidase MepM/ murein hydrolase activator NlpD
MKLSKQNVTKFVQKRMKPSKAIGLLIVSAATGMVQFAAISTAKANDFMNTYFRNGQVIKLVTPKGHNVNLPYPINGGMINTFQPDSTNDWKFVVIRTKDGIKLKRIGTDYLITAQKFPSHNLALLEAYKDVGGQDKYQTWIPTPSRQPGFFNICLLAQQEQCMNVPGSRNNIKLTTFKRDLNDEDQWFAAVVLENENPAPPTTGDGLHPNPTRSNPLKGFRNPLATQAPITQSPGGSLSHNGRAEYAIDFGVPIGTPVYAMRSGKVAKVVDKHPDAGGDFSNRNNVNYVVIEHGGGYYSTYLHLQEGFIQRVGIRVGQQVKSGDLIGYSGNSGWSTAPHLHVEVTKGRMFGQTVPFEIDNVFKF